MAQHQSGFRKWLPLGIMGLAVIIIVLDTTLLNVSLSAIVKDLDTNIQSLQWVIAAYSLTLAAFTITGGRFGDIFGRKKMFVIGAIVFATGSFLASISQNVPTLIIGESIVEGIGAAMMMPATASLLVANYQGHDRSLALGIWGGMAALGAAIGPVVGGWLTTHYSWRWGFRINVFVAAVLVIGSVLVHDAHEKHKDSYIDWLGVFLSASGLFLGVFAIIEGSTYGWFTAIGNEKLLGMNWGLSISIVPIAALLCVVLLGLFVWWEQKVTARGKLPLVSMSLFKNEQFTDGASLTAALSLGQIGLIFGVPVFLQTVRHMDALHTGYALLPLSFGLMIMAPLGGILSRRFVPKHIVQVGLFIALVGLVLLHQAISPTTEVSDLIIPLGLYGIGLGLNMSQLTNITLSAVSVKQSGEAAGVNNTIRQVGGSLGTAIIGTIIVASVSSGLHKGIEDSNKFTAQEKVVMADAVSSQSSSVEFGGKFESASQLTPVQQQEIKRIAVDSTVTADKRAFVFTIGTMFLSFILAAFLPKTRNLEKNQDLEKVDSEDAVPSVAH